MKKYLLFLFAMLTGAIGAWAESKCTYTQNSDESVTITIKAADDLYYDCDNGGTDGWTHFATEMSNTGIAGSATSIKLVTASGVTMSDNDAKMVSSYLNRKQRMDLSEAVGFSNAYLSGCYYQVLILPKGSEIPTDPNQFNTAGGSGSLLLYAHSSDGKTLNIWTNKPGDIKTAVEANDAVFTGVTTAIINGNSTYSAPSAEDRNALETKGITVIDPSAMGAITDAAQSASATSAIKTKVDLAASYGVSVTSITVTSGSLGSDDMTAFASISNVFTLDISGATATDTQLAVLLSNSNISSIALGSTNISTLRAASDNTIDVAKISDVTASSLIDGMSTKNFIIDGSTLYVTGTLTDGDLTSISSLISSKSITTLDVSNAIVMASQSATLLENASLNTVTLGATNFSTLVSTASGVTFTSAILTKMGVTAAELISGMSSNNNTNYIVDGATLYVTGTIADGDKTTIKTLLDGNTSVTTLDVSKCTNNSGTVTFTDNDISENVITLSLPGNEYINYTGSRAVALENGALTIAVPTPYATLSDALSSLSTLLSSGQVEHVKITGTLTAEDLSNVQTMASTYSGVKTIDLSAATSSSWSSLAGDFINNTGVLVPGTATIGSVTNAHVFTASGSVLNATKGSSDTNFNASVEFFAQNQNKSIVATSETDASALTALLALSGVNTIINNTSLAVTGELTNDVLQAVSTLAAGGSLTSLDFSGVTFVASDLNWNKLTAPTGLTSLTLPKNYTLTSSDATTLGTTFSSLMYAYSPTSNSGATVPDYVYVFKSGGLKEAFENNESTLGSGIYIKVASEAAITAEDMNFRAFTNNPTAYQFLDLSDANLLPIGAAGYTCTAKSGYRIILPDNWRGDQMAVFAANESKGSIAAVYSYSGTAMNILEIVDGSYSTEALHEPRIVRSGTDVINIISGTFGSSTYSSFGTNLLGAINGAQASIKTVNISVPYNDINQNIVFTNTNIETLNLTGFESLDAISVDRCSNLKSLILADAKIGQMTAQGLTKLEAVNLTNTEFTYSKDVSSGSGCINLTSSLHEGLVITYVQGFDTERIIPWSDAEKYKLEITLASIEVTCAADVSTNITAALADKAADGNSYAERDVTVLHVTGSLTAADITYITSNMHRLTLLDLSGATYSGDLTGDAIVAALFEAGMADKTALVFPANSSEHDLWYASKDPNYMKCAAYFADAAKKQLHAYGYDANVAKLAPVVTSGETSIFFAPTYKADPDVDLSAALPANNSLLYPSATSDFITGGLSELPAASIDLTWMNASTVGKNFSGLNAATHHITIPQNTASGSAADDFTNEGEGAGYSYSENIYTVSTYKALASPYATTATINQKGITVPDYIGKTINMVYVRTQGTGTLSGALASRSDVQSSADRTIVAGTIKAADITAMGTSNLASTQLDLSLTTLAAGADVKTLKNTNLKYLVLPNLTNGTADLVVSNYNTTNFDTGCPNLEGILQYDNGTHTLYTYSDIAGNDATCGYNDGNGVVSPSRAEVVMRMFADTNGSSNAISGLVMSGSMNVDDISMSRGLVKFTKTEAQVTVDSSSDPGASLVTGVTGGFTADLSEAYFPNNYDMQFANAGWANYLTAIDLPTYEKNKVIPANSLNNFHGIVDICVPYNYEKIENGVFANSYIKHITTTDANGAVIDNGDYTYTLSANLKQIGTDGTTKITKTEDVVFGSQTSKRVSDVYVLATTPPICPRGSFPAGMTYGWGGFDGGSVFCREKYHNGDFLFTVLHFPQGLGYDAEKLYTDPTRQYTKKDQTGALDANGDPIAWPTFSELCRAWNQAIRNKIWNDWVPGVKASEGIPDGHVVNSDETKSVATEQENQAHYDFTNYIGWHEFVLSVATYVAPAEHVKDDVVYRGYFKDGWYTLCIPFDMTEEEVVQLLGVPASTTSVKTKVGTFSETSPEKDETNNTDLMPDIYTLHSVGREVGDSRNSITLHLCENLNVTGKDASNSGEYAYYNPSTSSYQTNGTLGSKKVAIRGGYPYLIKPYLPNGTTIAQGSLGKYLLSRYAFALAASTVTTERAGCFIYLVDKREDAKFARPYDQYLVQATLTKGGKTFPATLDGEAPYNYRFIGQYWEQELPVNSYYLYASGANVASHKWYYYDTDRDYRWRAYTSIINVNSDTYLADGVEGSVIPTSTTTDAKGFYVFDKNLQLHYSVTAPRDDSEFSRYGVRDFYFVFDDGIQEIGQDSEQTTAIDKLNGADVRPLSGKVYDLKGRYMGDSIEGLRQGMYIVNGRKVVVK